MSKNTLSGASSPYLLQHADNPVHWHVWGEEALAEARNNNKPILLSVGYAACHWCHVMAKESFACPETAALMNRLFVNIKVDKEERPDIDKIYQTAHQLISKRGGGWPLTIFLEPSQQRPFFSGTYFPKQPRFNMPAFHDVLQRVHDYYMQHQEEIKNYGEEISRALAHLYAPGKQQTEIPAQILSLAVDKILSRYDRNNGGFGDAPKFPAHSYLHILLMQAMAEAKASAGRKSIEQTSSWQCFIHCLTAMSQSGLYDHLGGGYFRYTVDAQWTVPHFEKMLYDNGQLLSLMADAQAICHNDLLAEKIKETAQWLKHEMTATKGAFYSSLDADSDGVEGQFYLWDKTAVKELLTPTDYALAAMYFGLDQAANCDGKWNLQCRLDAATIAKKTSQLQAALQQHITNIMVQARAQRVRPHCDNKIIASWNGLAINGLAKAAMAGGEDSNYQAAKTALDFIRTHLWRDATLYTAGTEDSQQWCDGYLDDYALVIDAILSLLQYRWDDNDLYFALQLSDAALEKFEDQQHGGYFFTAADQTSLIQRPRILHDNSAPAGYGVLALNLSYLGWLCGRENYLTSAGRALAGAAETLAEEPHHCAHLLFLSEEIKNPSPIIIIRSAGDEQQAWLDIARQSVGKKLCFAIPADASLPPALASKKPNPHTIAYICYGTRCSPAITSLENFQQQCGQ